MGRRLAKPSRRRYGRAGFLRKNARGWCRGGFRIGRRWAGFAHHELDGATRLGNGRGRVEVEKAAAVALQKFSGRDCETSWEGVKLRSYENAILSRSPFVP